MENAAQALIIAAGVLVGILILSLAIYLGNVMGNYAAATQQKVDESAIAQFNTEFQKYNGLKDLTIQDIITIKNYALEHNQSYSGYDYTKHRALENNEYIDVYYDDKDSSQILIYTKNDEQLLKQALNKKFTCKVVTNTSTGRVNKIYFTEI